MFDHIQDRGDGSKLDIGNKTSSDLANRMKLFYELAQNCNYQLNDLSRCTNNFKMFHSEQLINCPSQVNNVWNCYGNHLEKDLSKIINECQRKGQDCDEIIEGRDNEIMKSFKDIDLKAAFTYLRFINGFPQQYFDTCSDNTDKCIKNKGSGNKECNESLLKMYTIMVDHIKVFYPKANDDLYDLKRCLYSADGSEKTCDLAIGRINIKFISLSTGGLLRASGFSEEQITAAFDLASNKEMEDNFTAISASLYWVYNGFQAKYFQLLRKQKDRAKYNMKSYTNM